MTCSYNYTATTNVQNNRYCYRIPGYRIPWPACTIYNYTVCQKSDNAIRQNNSWEYFSKCIHDETITIELTSYHTLKYLKDDSLGVTNLVQFWPHYYLLSGCHKDWRVNRVIKIYFQIVLYPELVLNDDLRWGQHTGLSTNSNQLFILLANGTESMSLRARSFGSIPE